jgi:hypothetical protein
MTTCWRTRAGMTTKDGSEMIRTAPAQHLAPVAGAARPCAGFGIGYQWRTVEFHDMASHAMKSVNLTTKRTTRRLGMATT